MSAQEPTEQTISAYLAKLKTELDDFLPQDDGLYQAEVRHVIAALCDIEPGIVAVSLAFVPDQPPRIYQADEDGATELAKIRALILRQHPIWCMDHDVVVSRGNAVYLLKPLKPFWWKEGRALIDMPNVVSAAVCEEK